jgi:alcohol dehydrogenase class IV
MPGIFRPNPAVFGAGSVAQIGERLRSISAIRAQLHSDKGLKAARHAGEVAGRLHQCRFARRHLPSRLRAPGVQPSMIPERARQAQLSAAIKDNPRPLDAMAATALYEEMI